MISHPTIALLTDFGYLDSYAAEMKAVILSINQQANIIDITHNINPQNVLQAGLILRRSYEFFPAGTIFVCVVDPQVGSERRIIYIQSAKYGFIAPDNGLLWMTAREVDVREIIALENFDYFLNKTPSTFEGRDKMAPVAAYASLGVDPNQFGPIQSGIEKLELTAPLWSRDLLAGEIVYFDGFGNAITNISFEDLVKNEAHNLPFVHFGSREIGHIVSTFADAFRGATLAYFGSSGYLELAVFAGNFRMEYSARVGDKVMVDHGKK